MRLVDFEFYKDLLMRELGLFLTPEKSYLVESRLTPVAKKWGYPTLEAMTIKLHGFADSALIKEIAEAMTTNETSFFRDKKPFDIFEQQILPFLGQSRKKTVNIWCAACSSGQEPYSLAMIIEENKKLLHGCRVNILATDVSQQILNKAKDGIYSQFEVQRGLPVQYLMKYFKENGDKWEITEKIKHAIDFKPLNLVRDNFNYTNLDLVLCRNVLIYFDEETKRSILDKISKVMAQDGLLMLGGSETVFGITDKFKSVGDVRGVYSISDNGEHPLARK